MGRENAAGKFVREDCQLRLAGAGGNLVAVTAAGDVLETNWNVERAWENWLALPEKKRQPGAVSVPREDESELPLTGPDGRLVRQPDPPDDALIVKVHFRALARDQDGLRHMQPDDIPGEHHMKRKQNYYDANPYHLWRKQAEWQALVPIDPKVGEKFPVPDAIAERIFRHHLNPTLAFGESNGLRREDIRSGKLELEVTKVTPQSISMKLTGDAQIGVDVATADAAAKEGRSAAGYEPQLLGRLTFDRKKSRFTQFDVVALGDTFGQLGGDLKYLYRPGRNPLGVALTIVPPDGPIADRTVPPRGMRFPRNYFVPEN